MPNLTQELIQLRDRDTKHFETDVPGTYVAKCVLNQHFSHRETGLWEETAYLTQPQPDGTYCTQARDVQFQVDPTTGTYYIHHQDNTITFQPVSLCLYDLSSGLVQDIADVNPTPIFSVEGNRFTWVDIFPNVDLILELSEFQIQKRLVFHQRPVMPDLLSLGMNPDTTRLVVTFAGRSVNPVALNQASTDAGWSGGIQDTIYIDWGNGSRLTIPKAIGWGSGNRPARDLEYIRDNVVNFGVAAPYSFIQAARYPVYIDPTVTLQTAIITDDASEYSQSAYATPIPLTYQSTQGDTAASNYLTCGAYITGGGKDPTSYQAARYFVRFNLNSIPFGSTMTSATLTMTVISGSSNASLKTVDLIPNWAIGSTPGATQWDVAAVATTSSVSTAGLVENFVFTSGVNTTFGSYAAFRIRFTSEATNTGNTSLYTCNGNPFSPSNHPSLTVIYTAPVSYPKATLVQSYSSTLRGGVNGTLSLPVAVGDLLVVAIAGTVTTLPWAISYSVSDNLGNTYILAYTTNDGTGSLQGTIAYFYSIVTAAGTPTLTLSPTGYNSLAWQVLHFSGCTFTYDVQASARSNNAGTLTASTAYTLLVVGTGGVNLFSPPTIVSGMTFPPVTFNLMTQANCTDTVSSAFVGCVFQYAQVGYWGNACQFTNGLNASLGIAFKLTSGGGGGAGELPRNAFIGS